MTALVMCIDAKRAFARPKAILLVANTGCGPIAHRLIALGHHSPPTVAWALTVVPWITACRSPSSHNAEYWIRLEAAMPFSSGQRPAGH